MVFITGRTKRSIEDHFDKAYEMEAELEARGKHELLRIARDTAPSHINCIYIRQSEPLGLGHAVLCASTVVGDEPFAVLLADDLIDAETPVLKQMADVFSYYRCSVLGTMEVPREQTRQYGIVSTQNEAGDVQRIKGIVEKPAPDQAPSNQAVVGRYILTPHIFDHLRRVTPGAGGEIQLTDAISSLLAEEAVLAYRFKGTRYDCGSKLGYLQATIALGRKHPEVGREFSQYLAGLDLSVEA
jgi:UTP--glucose-1-phosphate uridylyltransferase